MTFRELRWCAIPLTILMALTGCDTSNDDKPTVDRSSGPLSQQSFHWIASPGIDLVGGPAVPIRAYFESRLDGQTMGSLDYTYPGFDQAVAKKAQEGYDLLTSNLRPDVDRGAVNDPPVGSRRFIIQSVAHTGDAVSTNVCFYRYRLALENENGSFSSVAGTFVNDDGIDAFRLFLAAPPSTETSLPPQTGPASAPIDNVFGDWKITGLLDSFANSDPKFTGLWPTYDADLARCVADAPDPPDRRAFLSSGEHPRSDFPTSAPSPGWPEPAK